MSQVDLWLQDVIDLPRRDCERLLSEIAGLSQARILGFPETPITPQHQLALDDAVTKLRAGVPLAYVLGRQAFWTVDLKVTPAVLIPRPETELLVELVLELAPRNAHVLDLGTGSGAIAVALAHTRSDLAVTAVDRSADAIGVAQANAQRYSLPISFAISDWFSALSGCWQVIVCNPPYIAAGDGHLEHLAAEPQDALIAGADGLADLRSVIHSAPRFLSNSGYLIVEHGYNQAEQVRQVMEQAGFSAVRSVKDLAKIERATLGCWQDPAAKPHG